MLCSDCSKPVTPVVAVDIDGTLGDYHGHFIRFARQYLALDNTDWDPMASFHRFADYNGGVPFKQWACEAWNIDERTWHDIKLAYRQGAMKRSMPVYDGAARLCQAVKRHGAELWLTTTRPYLRLDNIDPDTRFWLEQHDLAVYDGLLYDELKYARLAEIVDKERVVAVVDDLIEMVEAARSQFGWKVPMLRGNDFNRAVKGERYELDQITLELAQRISEWKEKHDTRIHTN